MVGKWVLTNAGGFQPPTLDELRARFDEEQAGRSRFHKSLCPTCGALVTNQAMGRKSHFKACKKAHAKTTQE